VRMVSRDSHQRLGLMGNEIKTAIYAALIFVVIAVVVTFNFKAILNEGESIPKIQSDPNDIVYEEIAEEIDSGIFPIDEKQSTCLSLNIYHESRSDNFAGRVAVADVVLNRVDSSRYPNDICSVTEQSKTRVNWKGNTVPVRGMCQFSWYCDGVSDEPLDYDAWEDAKIIAEMMLTNQAFRGITEGSTHYHATYVKPNWINDRGMQYVGQIGQHKFYRWH